MKKQALVSIITPCYNGEDYLEKYFESILSQTYSNLELIFVNDGSTDATREIVNNYEEILKAKGIRFKYVEQKNGGQAKAMNTGFQHMTGEYLVWPDSDDLLDADSIEKRVRFLEDNPEYSFVRSNGYFFDYETGEKLYRISNLDNRFNEDIFLDLILERTYCCCGCYMIRTQALRRFYPELKIYESEAGQNWQILIPIAANYKCGYLDEDLYYIAVRQNSHSRKERNVEELIARYKELRKILDITIDIAGRKDRDYADLLDVKYKKIEMRVYLNHDELDSAKDCYKWLKDKGKLDDFDYELYIKKTCPFRFKVYCGFRLLHRIINKIKRLISNKKVMQNEREN